MNERVKYAVNIADNRLVVYTAAYDKTLNDLLHGCSV